MRKYLFLGLLFGFWACTSKQDMLQEAKNLMKKGKYAEAISILEGLDEQAEVLNAKGAAFLELGQNGKALDCLERAIAASPSDYRPYYNKGNVLRRMERFNDALEFYTKALEINSGEYEIFLNRALVLASLGRKVEAAVDFQSAAALDGGRDRNVYYYMGLNLLALGQAQQAIEPLAVSCALDTTFADSFYQLAMAQLGGGQTPKQVVCNNLSLAKRLGHSRAEAIQASICQ
jgi:tetratricopeptide (TPR) repeat protein